MNPFCPNIDIFVIDQCLAILFFLLVWTNLVVGICNVDVKREMVMMFDASISFEIR